MNVNKELVKSLITEAFDYLESQTTRWYVKVMLQTVEAIVIGSLDQLLAALGPKLLQLKDR